MSFARSRTANDRGLGNRNHEPCFTQDERSRRVARHQTLLDDFDALQSGKITKDEFQARSSARAAEARKDRQAALNR